MDEDEMFDYDDEIESENEGSVIQVPPRRPRESLIPFLNLVAQTPPSNSKQEALSQYAKEKIKRGKLLKQRRNAQERIKHFVNKLKKIEEELNKSDTELAKVEPIVLADLLNPN